PATPAASVKPPPRSRHGRSLKRARKTPARGQVPSPSVHTGLGRGAGMPDMPISPTDPRRPPEWFLSRPVERISGSSCYEFRTLKGLRTHCARECAHETITVQLVVTRRKRSEEHTSEL